VSAGGARVAVVGGGVSGLATAYRLLRGDPSRDVTVVEASGSVGGKLATANVGDLEVESGPDAFVARKPWAVDLCRELGLELAEPRARDAYAWTERGLVPLPASALGIPCDVDELARWPGLSRIGRARALADLVRGSQPPDEDESVGSLVRRRMGDEVADRLTGPLLAGLFAGDMDRLSVRATFPELARWERDFDSLIRGAKAAIKAATEAGPMFLRPREGVARLPAALFDAISAERVLLDAPALAIERSGDAFSVVAEAGAFDAEAVVLATPAFVSADMLEGSAPEAAAALRQIPYASTAVALLVYPPGTAEAIPEATGFVVPPGKAPMTAATFLSRKWPDERFGTRAVVRCFVGAVGFEDVLESPDTDIVEALSRHLAALLPLPDEPEASAVVRWLRSMPQYEVGHLERIEAIGSALAPGIFVTGNAYAGVGVADSVRSAGEAAERVSAHLSTLEERVR
jgi:protoporphyrinogen/coproporphyrinogen III oxidase